MSPSMQMSVEVSFINTSDRLSIYIREEAENSEDTEGLRGGEEATGRKEGKAAQTTKGGHQGQRDIQVPNSPRGISVSMCGFKAWATLSP